MITTITCIFLILCFFVYIWTITFEPFISFCYHFMHKIAECEPFTPTKATFNGKIISKTSEKELKPLFDLLAFRKKDAKAHGSKSIMINETEPPIIYNYNEKYKMWLWSETKIFAGMNK